MEHYRVRRDQRTWVTVDDEEYFENLFKLVEVRDFGNGLVSGRMVEGKRGEVKRGGREREIEREGRGRVSVCV